MTYYEMIEALEEISAQSLAIANQLTTMLELFETNGDDFQVVKKTGEVVPFKK